MDTKTRERELDVKILTRDFIFIWLANFFVFLSFQMSLPTIPIFVKSLGGSDQVVGVIVGIFTFSALLIRPYVGNALETKGRRFIYLTGLLVFILTIAIYSIVTSIVVLIIFRIIQGIGWGFSTTAAGTIVTDLIPPERRGEGMGYYGLSGNLATAIGPAVGLTLVNYITFTQLFLFMGSLAFIAFLFALSIRYKKVEESPTKSVVARFDVIEKTAINPSILLFFITFTFGGHSAFLPLYIVEKDLWGLQLFYVTFAVFIILSRIFAGKIYDARGDLYVVPTGSFLILIAMVLLTWLPNSAALLTAGALYGIGFGAVQPSLQAWAVTLAPLNRKGMANATFFSAFDLGVGVGALIFGVIAMIFGYREIYIISTFSVVVAIIYYFYLYFTGRSMTKKMKAKGDNE